MSSPGPNLARRTAAQWPIAARPTDALSRTRRDAPHANDPAAGGWTLGADESPSLAGVRNRSNNAMTARVLIVAQSAAVRDCHLWRRAMGFDPNIHLVLPGRRLPEWVIGDGVVDRVTLLPQRTLGSETSRWLVGLDAVIEGVKPDLIHVDAEAWSFTVQWLVRKGLPVVAHGAENLIVDAPWLYRVRRAGITTVLRRLAGYAAWGETSLHALREAGLPHHVPSVVVPARPPSPAEFRHVPPVERTETVRLAAVGRFEHAKGFDTIIDGAAQASAQGPVELHVMGQGPELTRLQELAAKAGVPVRFYGQGDAEGVASLLAESDAAVIASRDTRTWSEQWCRVAAEALLVGRPVFASSSGELPATVGVPNWIFETDNAHELALRVNSIRGSEQRSHAFALAVQQSKRFDLDRYSAELLTFWDTTCSSMVVRR